MRLKRPCVASLDQVDFVLDDEASLPPRGELGEVVKRRVSRRARR